MKIEDLRITGEGGKTLFYWKHAICIPGKNPLVLEDGKVRELMGSSPIEPDGPTIVLSETERCRGPRPSLYWKFDSPIDMVQYFHEGDESRS